MYLFLRWLFYKSIFLDVTEMKERTNIVLIGLYYKITQYVANLTFDRQKRPWRLTFYLNHVCLKKKTTDKLIKFAGALLPIMQLFWRCSSCRLAREYTNMGTPSKPFPERLSTRMLCITCISAGNWTNLFLLKSSSVKKENKTSLINKLKIKLKRRSRNYHNGDRTCCNSSVIWKAENGVINSQVGTRKILIKNSRIGGGVTSR